MAVCRNKPGEARVRGRRGARITLLSAGLLASLLAAHAGAQESPSPAPPSNPSLFDAPTLTGNWWGERDTLASHGVQLNLSLTQFYQGVAAGGIDSSFQYGGKLDCYLMFDGTKAGLLPGFSATAHLETRYGEDVNDTDGMFSLGNFNMSFPKSGDTSTGLTAMKFTQTLGNNFMLIAGKINTLDDFRLNFTGLNGLQRFMDSAVVANIINARTIPYSTYGAGFGVFADNGPEFLFLARDPDDHATTGLDNLFASGVVLTASLRMPVSPWGLPGTQVIGGNWSSKSYNSLDPSSWANIPGQGLAAPEKSGSWAAYYNFDQYLWVCPTDPDSYLGAFGMFGLSDGDPNPVRWNATVGLGAGGFVPCRKQDTAGAAYFHLGLSDNFKELLSGPPAPLGLAQRDEQGVELYYNAAVTPWCHLTLDLQCVEPSAVVAQTTLLAGLRLKLDF